MPLLEPPRAPTPAATLAAPPGTGHKSRPSTPMVFWSHYAPPKQVDRDRLNGAGQQVPAGDLDVVTQVVIGVVRRAEPPVALGVQRAAIEAAIVQQVAADAPHGARLGSYPH